MKLVPLMVVLTAALLAGCAPNTRPDNHALEREAIAGTHAPPPPPVSETQIQPLVQSAPQATTTIGTGSFINEQAARAAPPGSRQNEKGDIVFNFENQPVQAAVKAILGDVLHANYVVAPGVQGTITFSTSQPITREDVLPVLEMLLSWTNNALVKQGSRYVVMPAKLAAAGNLVPGLGAAAPGSGYAARLFPLHYVSADAMQKLLKPFAPSDAFLLVDPQRNILVMAGTPDQLANYQRTIRTFDVDWLRGMSVAVVPLQHVDASTLMPQLDQMFGAKGDSPLAGMARFIPLEHSNSIVVITSQPTYVDEVREFIAKIDAGAGGASGLYVYDVKNIKASDLAEHLNALYNGTPSGNANAGGQVAPGFSPLEQGSNGLGGTNGISNNGFGGLNGDNEGNTGGKDYTASGDNGMGADNGGLGGSLENGLPPRRGNGNNGNNQATTSYTTQSGVHLAAVDENNQLLVRARPSQWQEMLPVIQRLDQVPLQVQIETRVLEVDLTGQFSLGVQYYLEGLIGTQPGSPPGTNESFHRHQGAAGLGGVQYNPVSDALFYSFAGKDLQFALRGLETSGNTKILSEPSTVVLNNHETTIKVGDKIPVVQTYITPGLGSGSTNYNTASVQYIDTGVLLDVTPRVNPGGLVYLNIQQVVSKPTVRDQYGNYTIANRALSTQVAVQSGQTVLLGGLIQQSDIDTDNGIPFLNRIPVLGRLFGTTSRDHDRKELIVLITPRVISNAEQAREVTDEYQTKFESLKPILQHENDNERAPAGSPQASAGQPAVTSPVVPSPAEAVAAEPTGASAAPAHRGEWEVRVAAYSSQSLAEAEREHLRQLGFESHVVSTQSGDRTTWSVLAGPTATRSEAEALRASIQERTKIQGMTVMQAG
ncbi:MAG TPA: type II secretion system secretin GspD [Rhodanobacteraceae bacterium]|nr:type II secretion system secretin GspD [Rhodanobacteraceae bacterium]